MANSIPPMDTVPLGASPAETLSASAIPRAQIDSSNGSATLAISIGGPVGESFNDMKANDKWSIGTSASSKLLAIRDGSPSVLKAGRAHEASQIVQTAR